jgi:hypothetical protein
MDYKAIGRQIDRLESLIPPVPNTHQLRDGFSWELFTRSEQERLSVLIREVQPKIPISQWAPQLDGLTREEKDLLGTWIALDLALLEGAPEDEVAFYRAYLEYSEEDKARVWEAFRAIREWHIPEVKHVLEAEARRWCGTTYYLHRRAYQWNRQRLEQHWRRTGNFRCYELQVMWLWLSEYGTFVD